MYIYNFRLLVFDLERLPAVQHIFFIDSRECGNNFLTWDLRWILALAILVASYPVVEVASQEVGKFVLVISRTDFIHDHRNVCDIQSELFLVLNQFLSSHIRVIMYLSVSDKEDD